MLTYFVKRLRSGCGHRVRGDVPAVLHDLSDPRRPGFGRTGASGDRGNARRPARENGVEPAGNLVQFWNFYIGAWTGDLGEEVLSGRPVTTVCSRTVALHAGPDRRWHHVVGCAGHSAGLLGGGQPRQLGRPDRRYPVCGRDRGALLCYRDLCATDLCRELRWLPAIGAGEPGNLGDQLAP